MWIALVFGYSHRTLWGNRGLSDKTLDPMTKWSVAMGFSHRDFQITKCAHFWEGFQWQFGQWTAETGHNLCFRNSFCKLFPLLGRKNKNVFWNSLHWALGRIIPTWHQDGTKSTEIDTKNSENAYIKWIFQYANGVHIQWVIFISTYEHSEFQILNIANWIYTPFLFWSWVTLIFNNFSRN